MTKSRSLNEAPVVGFAVVDSWYKYTFPFYNIKAITTSQDENYRLVVSLDNSAAVNDSNS